MRKKTYAKKLDKIKYYYTSNPKLSNTIKAEKFLKEFRIKKYPINVVKLLTNMGFNIFLVNDLKYSSELMVVPSCRKESKTEKAIFISRQLSYEEKRVAIINELYYYLFYFDENIDLKYCHAITKSDSHTLNSFVSELLAPSNLISKYYKKYNKKFKYSSKLSIKNKVANHFEVPLELVENRL